MYSEIPTNNIVSIQKKGLYRRFLKRPLDFLIALVAIIVLSPILLVISVLVKFKLGSPILFKQKRPGLNEKIFTMYKFRTMTSEKDENGDLLPDCARMTNFGRMLRASSLDELPELLNILKGDMSIVGPRPQLIKDMVFMSPKQRQRHNVLPGLTGWAQVNGRNAITWEEKLSLDLEYIENVTFIQDMKIICKTIIKVFRRDGINAKGMDTAEDLGEYLLREKKISEMEYLAIMNKVSNF